MNKINLSSCSNNSILNTLEYRILKCIILLLIFITTRCSFARCHIHCIHCSSNRLFIKKLPWIHKIYFTSHPHRKAIPHLVWENYFVIISLPDPVNVHTMKCIRWHCGCLSSTRNWYHVALSLEVLLHCSSVMDINAQWHGWNSGSCKSSEAPGMKDMQNSRKVQEAILIYDPEHVIICKSILDTNSLKQWP